MRLLPLLVFMVIIGVVAQNSAPTGATVYQQCQGCHQPTGQGIPGAFPPLAGNVQTILTAKGGRAYLIHVVLYGVQGPIKVKGQTYNGAMPGFAQLSDNQAAAVLNHVSTSWGNKLPKGQKAFTAAEVKAQRAKKLTPAQVAAERQKLGLK